MGYAAATQTIHAPIEAVWHALNDIGNTSKWVVGLENAEMKTTGVYGEGSVYVDYNRLGPMLQVTEWSVTEYEPLSRQVHVSDSRFLPSMMVLTLIPRTDGTRLRMTVDYRLFPKLGIVSRWMEKLVMNHLLQGVLKQNMNHLNSYLQAEARTLQPVTS